MSSTAPGTSVNVSAAPAPGASSSPTGTLFMTALTQRGPVGVPITLTSLNDYINLCGQRVSYGAGYDAAEVFFAGGGTLCQLSRVVGPAATAASITLKDSNAANTVTVSSNGPGVDGNNLAVAVIAGSVTGSYQLQVFYNGKLVETSPLLLVASDAVNWGTLTPASIATNASKWVTITSVGAGTAPAVAASASLTGGLDDNSNASDTQFTAALAAFPASMGPGQVAAPGRTTAPTWLALATHGAQNNRLALLDHPNQASAATIAAAAATLQTSLANAGIDSSYWTVAGAWTVWPGIATGTPVQSWNRQIPASAGAAALMAANDAVNDCNVAAAGNNGILAGALGVAQSFSASDRAVLNAAGCSLFRYEYGAVKLYGYVSGATDTRWTDLANVRFRMQLVHDANVIGDGYNFSQVTPAVISDFNGALTANLAAYYAKGSLYGTTPAQAYAVNTGPAVNTPQTIAARQLNAIESVVMSPSAQSVDIGIVKYAVGQTIPAAA